MFGAWKLKRNRELLKGKKHSIVFSFVYWSFSLVVFSVVYIVMRLCAWLWQRYDMNIKMEWHILCYVQLQWNKTGKHETTENFFGIKSQWHNQIISGMGCDTRYRVWQLVTNNHRTIIDGHQVTMKLFSFQSPWFIQQTTS